jgi:hypothetical protein
MSERKSFWVIFLVCLFGFIVLFNPFSAKPRWMTGDFSHYWCTGRLVLEGTNPYGVNFSQHRVGESFDWTSPYMIRYASNPPPLLLFLLPLAFFEPNTAWWLWMMLSMVVFAAALASLSYFFSGESRVFPEWMPAVVIPIATLMAFPTWDWIGHGQISGLLAALLIIACWCWAKNWDFWAGVLCGITAGLKVYPGLTFIYFAAARNKQAMLGFILGFSLMILLPVLVFSTSIYEQWLGAGMKVISDGEKDMTNNMGLTGLIYKMKHLLGWGHSRWQMERILPLLFALVMAALLGFKLRQQKFKAPALALVISWAALCSPVSWSHYGCHYLIVSFLFLSLGAVTIPCLFWAFSLSVFAYLVMPSMGSLYFFSVLTLVTWLCLSWMTWLILNKQIKTQKSPA